MSEERPGKVNVETEWEEAIDRFTTRLGEERKGRSNIEADWKEAIAGSAAGLADGRPKSNAPVRNKLSIKEAFETGVNLVRDTYSRLEQWGGDKIKHVDASNSHGPQLSAVKARELIEHPGKILSKLFATTALASEKDIPEFSQARARELIINSTKRAAIIVTGGGEPASPAQDTRGKNSPNAP